MKINSKMELTAKYPLTWRDVKVGHTYIMYDDYWKEESKVFILFGGWAKYVDQIDRDSQFVYQHNYNYFKEV